MTRILILSPQLKLIYEHKEKFRSIFDRHLTRKLGEIELNQWIDEAQKMGSSWIVMEFAL